MGILLAREAATVLLTALFAMFGVPAILGVAPTFGLFWAGLLMAMAFMTMYAIGVLGGNKMPRRALPVMGLLVWAAAFAGIWRDPGEGQEAVLWSAGGPVPILLGPLLALLGGIRGKSGARGTEALSALYAYSFPMLAGRWVLLPMLLENPVAPGLAWLTGTFYTACRVLLRTFWPGSVEGDAAAPPLVHRPVPDAVAGLVERSAGRRARPYYTDAAGHECGDGISVLVAPEEAEAVAARVTAALGEQPFAVEVGEPAEGKLEIVVRHRS